jgi:hypothetical protein
MKIKNEYKGLTLTINHKVLGEIKLDLGELKVAEIKKYVAAGYIPEAYIDKKKKNGGATIQDSVVEQDNGDA